MRQKYLNGDLWNWVEESTTSIRRVDDFLSGFLSVVEMHKVKRRIVVKFEGTDLCVADDGYKWLAFLPDGKKWCMTAMYDTSGKIVEWYYDIIKDSYIAENGEPFYDDLYLDIAVTPDGRKTILDEDELKAALDSGEITQADYRMAHDVCAELLDSNVTDKNFIGAFCEKYLR